MPIPSGHISYHVYGNGGAGGPVDYTTPVATTASLTYTPAALATGSDWTFALRAFDTTTGYEEKNVDARIRIIVSSTGADVSKVPNAPTGLATKTVRPGVLMASWLYMQTGQAALPTGFHVYGGYPSISYTSPIATVPYFTSSRHFTFDVTGLSGPIVLGVRAYNSTGEEKNTVTVTATPLFSSGAPSVPDAVSASVIA